VDLRDEPLGTHGSGRHRGAGDRVARDHGLAPVPRRRRAERLDVGVQIVLELVRRELHERLHLDALVQVDDEDGEQ
jgi:hypothetical protein